MKCPYCDTEFDLETLAAFDEELKGEKADDISWQTPNETWAEQELGQEGMKLYVCESCGGEVVTEATTAAMKCPWCDNPIIMKGNVAGGLRPDYVIPFKLDKEAAKKKLTEHFEGKKLLPAVFKDQNHIDEIKGVYVPFWLFDADADADVRFKGTKTRSWISGSYSYLETSYYSVVRGGSIGFDNVPVDGSGKMDDKLMESLEPFDTSAMVDFQTAYLSGYLADKYDVSSEVSMERANARVKKSAEDAFARTVSGYSSLTPQTSSAQIENGKAKYALYPVWLLNTTWNGTKYVFAMNGQTGKFVGDLPVDKSLKTKYYWGKFLKTGLITFAVVLAFWLLLSGM